MPYDPSKPSTDIDPVESAATVETPTTVQPPPALGYGNRADGTKKGPGFFGELKRPDGKISTELSIGVDLDGKETEIPSLVPTLTQIEIDHLLAGGDPTNEIVHKAADHAKKRLSQGLSPFKAEREFDPNKPSVDLAPTKGVNPSMPSRAFDPSRPSTDIAPEETEEEFKAKERAKTYSEMAGAAVEALPEMGVGLAKGLGKVLAIPVTQPFHGTRWAYRKAIGDEKGAKEDMDAAVKTAVSVGLGLADIYLFLPKVAWDAGQTTSKQLLAPTGEYIDSKIAEAQHWINPEGYNEVAPLTFSKAILDADEERLHKKWLQKKDAEKGINPAGTTVGDLAVQFDLATPEQVSRLEHTYVDPDVMLASMMVGPVAGGAVKRALAGATKPVAATAERIAAEASKAASEKAANEVAGAGAKAVTEKIITGAEQAGKKIKEVKEAIAGEAGAAKEAVTGALGSVPGVPTILRGGRILEKARPIYETLSGVGRALTEGSRAGRGALETAAMSGEATTEGARKALMFAGKVGGNIPINVIRNTVQNIPSTLQAAAHGAVVMGLAEGAKSGDVEGLIHGGISGAALGAGTRVGLVPFEGHKRVYAEGVRTVEDWLQNKTPEQRDAIIRSTKYTFIQKDGVEHPPNTIEDLVRLADMESIASGIQRSTGKNMIFRYGDVESHVAEWKKENPAATPQELAEFKKDISQRGFAQQDFGNNKAVAYININHGRSGQTAFHEALHVMFRSAPEGTAAAEQYKMAKQRLKKAINDEYTTEEMSNHLRGYQKKLINSAYNNVSHGKLTPEQYYKVRDAIIAIDDNARKLAAEATPDVAEEILKKAERDKFKLARKTHGDMTAEEALAWSRGIVSSEAFYRTHVKRLNDMLDAKGNITEAGRNYIAEELLAEHNRSFLTRVKGFIGPTSTRISRTEEGADISKYFNKQHVVQIADEGVLGGISRLLGTAGVKLDSTGAPVGANGKPVSSMDDLPFKVFSGMKASPVIDRLLADMWAKRANSIERFGLGVEAKDKIVEIMEPSMVFGVDAKKFIPLAMRMGAIRVTEDAEGNEVPVLDKQGKPIFIKPKDREKETLRRDRLIQNAIVRGGVPDEPGALIPDQESLRKNGRLTGSFLGEKSMTAILADPQIPASIKKRIIEWNTILKDRWTAENRGMMRDRIVEYNKVYSRGKAGSYATEQRFISPIGIQITGAGNVNLLLFDVGHFAAKLNKTLEGKPTLLAHWMGDRQALLEDIYKVMDNHFNGRPGASGLSAASTDPMNIDRIGVEKASIINALLDFGTKENRAANPWYDFVNRRGVADESSEPGSIRSFRLERVLSSTPSNSTPIFIDYRKGVQNFMAGEGERTPEERALNERLIKSGVVKPLQGVQPVLAGKSPLLALEAIPGGDTGVLSGIQSESFKAKVPYTRKAVDALLEGKAIDPLSEALGLQPVYPKIMLPGAWQREVNPMIPIYFKNPEVHPDGTLTEAYKDKLDVLSAGLGKALVQQMVGYTHITTADTMASANLMSATIDGGRILTPKESLAVTERLDDKLPGGYALINDRSGVRFLNLSNLTAEKFQLAVQDALEYGSNARSADFFHWRNDANFPADAGNIGENYDQIIDQKKNQVHVAARHAGPSDIQSAVDLLQQRVRPIVTAERKARGLPEQEWGGIRYMASDRDDPHFLVRPQQIRSTSGAIPRGGGKNRLAQPPQAVAAETIRNKINYSDVEKEYERVLDIAASDHDKRGELDLFLRQYASVHDIPYTVTGNRLNNFGDVNSAVNSDLASRLKNQKPGALGAMKFGGEAWVMFDAKNKVAYKIAPEIKGLGYGLHGDMSIVGQDGVGLIKYSGGTRDQYLENIGDHEILGPSSDAYYLGETGKVILTATPLLETKVSASDANDFLIQNGARKVKSEATADSPTSTGTNEWLKKDADGQWWLATDTNAGNFLRDDSGNVVANDLSMVRVSESDAQKMLAAAPVASAPLAAVPPVAPKVAAPLAAVHPQTASPVPAPAPVVPPPKRLFMPASEAGPEGMTRKQVEEAKTAWDKDGTDSQYFKAWFGKSKVVDDKTGKPMIVYHATESNKPFSIFKNNENTEGFFFTPDINFAKDFADQNAKIGSYYINLKNPIDLRRETKEQRQMLKNLGWNGAYKKEEGVVLPLYEAFNTDGIVNRLKKLGYDGAILDEHQGADSYVAFNPNQIKSATDNIGTFSKSKDIRFMPAERDQAYLKAVEAGDTATAQKLVDEAAKAAGYGLPLYHARFASFNEFRPFQHFGTRGQASKVLREVQRRKLAGHENGNIIRVALNIKNPLRTEEAPMGDWGDPFSARQAIRNSLIKAGDTVPKTVDATPTFENLTRMLKTKGYDGIVYDNKFEGKGDSYIALDPSQIKSADPITRDDAGNVIPLSQRFNPKSKDIRFMPAEPVFKSNILSGLDTMPEKMATQELLFRVNKIAGARKEADWIGLDDFLAGKKSVTRQEVKDFVEANQVVVTERLLGEPVSAEIQNRNGNLREQSRIADIQMQDAWDKLGTAYQMAHPEVSPLAVNSNLAAMRFPEIRKEFPREGAIYIEAADRANKAGDAAREALRSVGALGGNAKYGDRPDLMTAGAKPGTYRELLLKLPQRYITWTYRVVRDGDQVRVVKSDGQTEVTNWTGRASAEDEQRLREEYDGKTFEEKRKLFTGGHYDPNTFAHVRWSERTGPNGERIMFIEEFQSDWDLAARKLRQKGEGDYGSGVEDSPFRGDWSRPTAKRVLRWAADNGYDKVAWTTGDMQIERYDLRKQVKSITANKNADGTFELFYVKQGDDGTRPLAENAKAEALDGIVGKELAQKIAAQTEDGKTYEGLDLKVGGEGKKKLYDEIIPQEMNKIGKKFGAKVGATEIQTVPESEAELITGTKFTKPSQSVTAHSMDITPSMKEGIAGKAQMMFMPAERDAAYLKAVEAGDTATVQKMVDEAAKSAGYNLVGMRHGTTNEKLGTSEDPYFRKEKIRSHETDAPFNGFWFTNSESASPAWTNAKKTLSVSLRLNNAAPWDVIRKVAAEVHNNSIHREGARGYADEVRMRLEEMGYDGAYHYYPPEIKESVLNKTGRFDYQTVRGSKRSIVKHPEGHIDYYEGNELVTGYEDLADFKDQHKEKVAVVFDPSQIKSADPITRDAAGNVIPLSQRFNPKSNDIRYMPAERDAAYLKAVESGDTETAQKMVDEAAKAAGYVHDTFKGYYPKDYETGEPLTVIARPSDFPAFNKGEKGVKIAGFFAEDKNVADKFKLGTEGITDRFYIRMENPFIMDAKGNAAGVMQFEESGKPFREAIRSGKYDGVIIKNTKDEGTIFVTLRPEGAKLADTITRDDAGNVIPLSKRFNPESNDIRYMPAEKVVHEQTISMRPFLDDEQAPAIRFMPVSAGKAKLLGIEDDKPSLYLLERYSNIAQGIGNAQQLKDRLNLELNGLKNELQATPGKYHSQQVDVARMKAQAQDMVQNGAQGGDARRSAQKILEADENQLKIYADMYLKQIQGQQSQVFEQWVDYVSNGGYSEAQQYLLLHSMATEMASRNPDGTVRITKLGGNSERTSVSPSPDVAGRVMGMIQAGGEPKRVSQMWLEASDEAEKASRASRERVPAKTDTGIDGEWIKFPSKANDPVNFSKNVSDLEALAKTSADFGERSWCTGLGQANYQLSNGDFWIYTVDNKARVAIRMDGSDQIGEMSGILKGQYLEPQMAPVALKLVKEKGFIGGEDFITDAVLRQGLRSIETDLAGGKIDKAAAVDAAKKVIEDAKYDLHDASSRPYVVDEKGAVVVTDNGFEVSQGKKVLRARGRYHNEDILDLYPALRDAVNSPDAQRYSHLHPELNASEPISYVIQSPTDLSNAGMTSRIMSESKMATLDVQADANLFALTKLHTLEIDARTPAGHQPTVKAPLLESVSVVRMEPGSKLDAPKLNNFSYIKSGDVWIFGSKRITQDQRANLIENGKTVHTGDMPWKDVKPSNFPAKSLFNHSSENPERPALYKRVFITEWNGEKVAMSTDGVRAIVIPFDANLQLDRSYNIADEQRIADIQNAFRPEDIPQDLRNVSVGDMIPSEGSVYASHEFPKGGLIDLINSNRAASENKIDVTPQFLNTLRAQSSINQKLLGTKDSVRGSRVERIPTKIEITVREDENTSIEYSVLINPVYMEGLIKTFHENGIHDLEILIPPGYEAIIIQSKSVKGAVAALMPIRDTGQGSFSIPDAPRPANADAILANIKIAPPKRGKAISYMPSEGSGEPLPRLENGSVTKFTPDLAIRFMPSNAKVDLRDYADRQIIALAADRLGVGPMATGPEGKKKIMSADAQGGRGFMNIFNGGGWAFTNEQTANRFLTRAKEVADKDGKALVAVTVLSPINHLNSPYGQLGMSNAIRAAIENGDISEKSADRQIRAILAKVKRSPKLEGNRSMAAVREIKTFADYEKVVNDKSLNFQVAAEIVDRAQNVNLPISEETRAGAGIDIATIAKDLSDPELSDIPAGSVVALMEIDTRKAPTRDNFHYSYPVSIHGKRIGFLKDFPNIQDLTSSEKIYSGKATGKRILAPKPLQAVMPELDLLGKSKGNWIPSNLRSRRSLENLKAPENKPTRAQTLAGVSR